MASALWSLQGFLCHCERSEAIPPSLRAQLVIASAAKQSSLALASHGNSNAAHRSKAATFATHPSRLGWRDERSRPIIRSMHQSDTVSRNMTQHTADWGPFCERKSSKMRPQFGGKAVCFGLRPRNDARLLRFARNDERSFAMTGRKKARMKRAFEGSGRRITSCLCPWQVQRPQAQPLVRLLQPRTPRSPTRGCFCHAPRL